MTDAAVIVTDERDGEFLPAVRAHEAMVTRAEVSVDEVIAQRDKIKAVMDRVMVEGVHYGKIPGVSKPTLFKSGAEVLNTTLRLAPSYVSERMFSDDGHLTVIAKCRLTHAPSGILLAEGEGLCSSREAKYAWRASSRSCPACGAEAIIKGKAEYGGGWLCWKNHKTNPGCGAKYAEGDQAIEGQATGKVENPDLPDTWNTVLKMADKRALVAAVLNGTAASDIFTQDVEDSSAAVATEQAADRPRLERLRERLADLAVAADAKRECESGTSAGEIAPKTEGADEEALTNLGHDVVDWIREGCTVPFTEYEPVSF